MVRRNDDVRFSIMMGPIRVEQMRDWAQALRVVLACPCDCCYCCYCCVVARLAVRVRGESGGERGLAGWREATTEGARATWEMESTLLAELCWLNFAG